MSYYHNNNYRRNDSYRDPRLLPELTIPVNVEEIVYDNDIERALRKFRRKVRECGVLQEVYERKTFIKPSTKKHNQKAKQKYIREKKNQEEQLAKTTKRKN